MKRWVFVAPFISLVFIVALFFMYNQYRNNVTHKLIDENTARIQEQNLLNNQKFCRVLFLIIDEGRPGPFRDAIVDLYNDESYQCQKVENQYVDR